MKGKTIHIIYAGLGGHFDYVLNLVQAMNANATTHIVFFGIEPVPGYYTQTCEKNGISYSAVLKKGLGISAALKLLRILRRQKPDLIYVHSNAATLPAKWYQNRRAVKLVLIEHHNNQLKTAKDHNRSRFAQRKFDRVVFLTQAHREEACERMKAYFNAAKSVVIQTGIPDAYFNDPRTRTGIKGVIGMQSRLVPIKDHETLIRAFKEVLNQFPETTLRIAGEGAEQPRLEKIVKELGIQRNVCFDGMLPKQELITWLGKLNIYVHATLGETSSIALMEALAQGLPVIASDVTGIRGFLTGETAILVPPKDVFQLQQAISGLLQDEKKCSYLSENAFNFAAANCSLQKMAAAYQQLEQDILK